MYKRYIILYFLFFPFSIFSITPLPQDMHELALSSLDHIYLEEFKQAENDAKRIIRRYPDHPAGYFFYSVVLNSYMEYLQSEKYEAEFYRNCDMAIMKGEILLERQPDNTWCKFFIAGAYGIMGTYESRYERWITSFKHGWRGVVIFKEIYENYPELKDVLYGIATYNYWRRTMIKLLWWMPWVEDKRVSAINTLYSVLTKGIYVKESAALNLIEILCNKKRYAEAIKVADKMLIKYPTNITCIWGKAKAQLGLKKYDKAEVSIRYILKRVENGSFESNYHITLCHYYLMKIYFLKKQYDLCMEQYDKMLSFELSSVSKKRLEKYFEDAVEIKRKLTHFDDKTDLAVEK